MCRHNQDDDEEHNNPRVRPPMPFHDARPDSTIRPTSCELNNDARARVQFTGRPRARLRAARCLARLDVADEVLRNYAHRVDQPFRERLRFLARVLSVMWLAEACEWTPDAAADVARHVRWVHNVFATRAPGPR
jgi:hypothetical protein